MAAKHFKSEDQKASIAALESVPCTYNITPNLLTTRFDRMQGLRIKLQEEIEEAHIDERDENQNENLLSCVCYWLQDKSSALEINERILERTKSSPNLTALANAAYFAFFSGDELLAEDYLKQIEDLRLQAEMYAELVVKAKTEQAYSLGRMGGAEHLLKSVELYEQVMEEEKDSAHVYGLGRVCRKLAYINIATESSSHIDSEGYLKKSTELLFNVAENEGAKSLLRSLAYSELAIARRFQRWHQYNEYFKYRDCKYLSEMALVIYEPSTSRILMNCGIALSVIDLERSIGLQKMSIERRKTSKAYHYLGKCLRRKAILITQGKYHYTERWQNCTQHPHFESRRSITTPVRRVRQNNYTRLNENDAIFKEAKTCFEEAFRLSGKENMGALCDSGSLYKSANDIKEALKCFNQVTLLSQIDTINVIFAFEQAGLCLRELGQTNSNHDYIYTAEKKFMAAIQRAASLVKRDPRFAQMQFNICDSFSILKTKYATESKYKDLMKLLELVEDYGDIEPIMRDILENNRDEISDPEVLTTYLESLLRTGKPQSACSVLYILKLHPKFTSLPRHIENRVILANIEDSLTRWSGNPSQMCKDMFLSRYKLDVDQTDEKVHVLVFHDEEQDMEGSASLPTQYARRFQKLITEGFGLNCSLNLQRAGFGRPDTSVQAEMFLQSPVILVVLGDQNDESSYFSGMLEYLMSIPSGDEQTTKQILILSIDEQRNIPHCLAPFPHRVMSDFETFRLSSADSATPPYCCRNSPIASADSSGSFNAEVDSVLNRMFDGDVRSMMNLFGFLIQVDLSTGNDVESVATRDAPE